MKSFFQFLRNLRLVWWFVAALVALFAADRADAVEITDLPSQATAYDQCMDDLEAAGGPGGLTPRGGEIVACTGIYTDHGTPYYTIYSLYIWNDYHYVSSGACPPGQEPQRDANPDTGPSTVLTCVAPGYTPEENAACANALEQDQNIQYPNGSVHCDALTECMMTAINIGDGGQVRLVPYLQEEGVGQRCLPADDCPAGMTEAGEEVLVLNDTKVCLPDDGDADGDGLSNDEDPTPNEYGDQLRDSDGDGVPDSRDPFPLDPDNGKNKEDGETVNTSTGGGNCQSPPTSHGDAIAGNIAYQTWATRCAVDRLAKITKDGSAKVTVVGGVVGGGTGEVDGGVSGGENCVHTYNITGGDPINAQALVEAQRLRCQQKADRLADEAGAGDVGDTSSDGSGAWQEASVLLPDESGYGWDSGGLPWTSMSIGGASYSLPFGEKRADAFNTFKALVIFMASVACYFILADA